MNANEARRSLLWARSGLRLLLLILGFSLFGINGCRERGGEAEEKNAREEATVTPTSVATNTGTMPMLTLSTGAQQRIGLRTAGLVRTRMSREAKGYGRVLDPSSLITGCAELAAADAAATASRQEFERLRSLHAEGQNASLRALQAAEAAAKRDRLQVETARARLVLAWGQAVIERDDLAGLAHALTIQDKLLVRVDLPAGEGTPTPPARARLVEAARPDQTAMAEFLNRVTGTDPRTQGQGFMFLMATNSWRWPFDTAVIGYLQGAGEPWTGIIVPRSAVVRSAGKAWVYVRTKPGQFTRREVVLDWPAEAGWFIRTGLTEQDELVVVGAQLLLSEEQKTLIQMID
jgi:hypothetical protein